MTTRPLKEPLNLKATLYHSDSLLAEVSCQLSPVDAPVIGMALVPDNLDWLSLSPLSLVLRDGRRYRILPAKLERLAGGKGLFRFYIRP